MGNGPNALYIEDSLDASQPQRGFIEDFFVPLPAFRTLAGVGLSTAAAATPYMTQPDSVNFPLLHAIRWRQDADATTPVVFNFKVPGQYNQLTDSLIVIPSLRKADDAADENATLQFKVDANWARPGWVDPAAADAAVPTSKRAPAGAFKLAAPVVRTLTANVATATMNWNDYLFNLNKGAGRSLTQQILPHDELSILIGPAQTVGAVDMFVDMKGCLVRWARGASLFDKQSRHDRYRVSATS